MVSLTTFRLPIHFPIFTEWDKGCKKLSTSRIKRLLSLSYFIVSQNSNDKTKCLSFLNKNLKNEIPESIYNVFYTEKLNTNLSKSLKANKKSYNLIHEVLKIYLKENFYI